MHKIVPTKGAIFQFKNVAAVNPFHVKLRTFEPNKNHIDIFYTIPNFRWLSNQHIFQLIVLHILDSKFSNVTWIGGKLFGCLVVIKILRFDGLSILSLVSQCQTFQNGFLTNRNYEAIFHYFFDKLSRRFDVILYNIFLSVRTISVECIYLLRCYKLIECRFKVSGNGFSLFIFDFISFLEKDEL